MSMIIKLTGSKAYSNPKLPRVVAYRYGFPKNNLQGLYLCEEGEVDQQHSGALLDSSGNNNHANLKAGWIQPTKRAYGLEMAAGGAAWLSPIKFGAKFTFVIATQVNEPAPVGASRYPYVLGGVHTVASGPNGTAANTGDIERRTFLNVPLDAAGNSQFMFFNNGGPSSSGPFNPARNNGTTFNVSEPAANFAKQVRLVGMTYDSTTKALKAQVYGLAAASIEATANLFNVDDLIAFGLMPFQGGQSAVAGSRIHLAGVWSDSSADLLADVLYGANERLKKRSVTVAT